MERSRGFTLIELMIVVAIIGILASVAYPAYINQVRESRQTEAKSALHEAMSRQERHYTTDNTYTNDMTDLGYDSDPFLTEGDWYQVDAAACGGGLDQCVQLTATAQDDQTNDACGNFTLNSRGQRSVSGSGDCW